MPPYLGHAPTTAVERDWKRNFHVDGVEIEIPRTKSRKALPEIVSIFQNHGFDIQVLIEPTFDLSERTIFELAGKLNDYEDLAGVPAIYILKLQKTNAELLLVSFSESPRLPVHWCTHRSRA